MGPWRRKPWWRRVRCTARWLTRRRRSEGRWRRPSASRESLAGYELKCWQNSRTNSTHQESSTAVPEAKIRETPDVAETECIVHAGEDKLDGISPVATLHECIRWWCLHGLLRLACRCELRRNKFTRQIITFRWSFLCHFAQLSIKTKAWPWRRFQEIFQVYEASPLRTCRQRLSPKATHDWILYFFRSPIRFKIEVLSLRSILN